MLLFILQVSGVVVMDKDSYFFTDTLREPRTSGYLVCSRPLHPNSHKAPSSNSDKMAAIYGAPSEENTQNDSVSIEIESGIERGETVSTSDGKISDIRRKFETSLQEIPRESPKLETLPDKVVQPQNGRKMSDEIRRNSSYESHNSSGYSPNYPDGTVEIVVSKIRGELIGITLGASDEADGGFVVTDVTTNGALYRTLHSVPDYRDVRFSLGDVVTELNGKSLRGATLFGVQSLLWDLFSVEGNVSLKFKPKSASKFQIRYPIKTVEEVTISDSESPGVVSSRKSPIHLISGSSQQSSSRSYSVGIRKESIRNDQTPSTLKSSGTMSNENNSSETFNPNNYGSSKGSAQEQTFSTTPKKRNHRYRSEDHAGRIHRRRARTLSSETEVHSLPRISHSCRGDIEQLYKKHPSPATYKKTSNKQRTTSRTPTDELRRRYAQKSIANFGSTRKEHSTYLAKDYEENWSKPFSVTLNPGDENLPIKILSR
ncbi:unnamed protein product [Hymenolepis diminuta]|uniref:PDZ domain-containing protein n=1 Tax=Hymenolepis diminuta TaxID=6216 RepID=A0A158QDZ2_HYMDI|nr:unnamed protein product [Hymenolepis diminuta]